MFCYIEHKQNILINEHWIMILLQERWSTVENDGNLRAFWKLETYHTTQGVWISGHSSNGTMKELPLVISWLARYMTSCTSFKRLMIGIKAMLTRIMAFKDIFIDSENIQQSRLFEVIFKHENDTRIKN